jgi:hypothetical protein
VTDLAARNTAPVDKTSPGAANGSKWLLDGCSKHRTCRQNQPRGRKWLEMAARVYSKHRNCRQNLPLSLPRSRSCLEMPRASRCHFVFCARKLLSFVRQFEFQCITNGLPNPPLCSGSPKNTVIICCLLHVAARTRSLRSRRMRQASCMLCKGCNGSTWLCAYYARVQTICCQSRNMLELFNICWWM